MKRCPTCQSTYTDNTLLYCLTDGAALIENAGFDPQATFPNGPQSTLRDDNRATMPDDERATLLYPSARGTESPPVAAPGANTPREEWRPAPTWGAPTPYPATPLRRRPSYTAWIIGAVAVLVLGIIITVIVASRRSAAETPGTNNSNVANRNANQNVNTPPPPLSVNVNQNAGGNTNQHGADNGNSNQQGAETESPPTDPDLVLSQLTALENEWNDANIKGNKAAVRRIVADEFRGVGASGSVENKEQMLASMQATPQISLKLSDLKVSLAGHTAVVTGLNTATSTSKQVLKFRFTDTFIWRQGRWQAISSQSSQVK
jgi:hypothetical protein